MIIDNIRNAKDYYVLGNSIKKALKYLQSTNFTNVKPGRYDIEGDLVYALVQSYQSKPIEEGKIEAHKKYIDIQYIFDGCETMGYANIDGLETKCGYDSNNDVIIYSGECSMVKYEKGMFAIFFPQDAHMPCIAFDKPAQVKKIVVKVKWE